MPDRIGAAGESAQNGSRMPSPILVQEVQSLGGGAGWSEPGVPDPADEPYCWLWEDLAGWIPICADYKSALYRRGRYAGSGRLCSLCTVRQRHRCGCWYYTGIRFAKHSGPIRQFLIYIGTDPLPTPTDLNEPGLLTAIAMAWWICIRSAVLAC